MESGKLRHRIQIQSRKETTRALDGGITESWDDVAGGEVWGSVEPLSGREIFQAQQVQSRATTRIRIRYHSALTTKHRLRHILNDATPPTVLGTYNVLHVANVDQRNREIEVICMKSE